MVVTASRISTSTACTSAAVHPKPSSVSPEAAQAAKEMKHNTDVTEAEQRDISL
jgi:hypothetical protein